MRTKRFFCHICGKMISYGKVSRSAAINRHWKKHHKKKKGKKI